MMRLLDHMLYRKDLERCLDSCVLLEKLKGKTILVTGATGLICSAFVDLLLVANEKKNLSTRVVVCGRSQEKAALRFDFGRDDIHFHNYDATKRNQFSSVDADYIVCGAGLVSPEFYVSRPVDTMLTTIDGVRELLEYCRGRSGRRLLFLSSSEVYGRKEHEDPFLEEEYGYVDVLSVRSSYPMAKRAAETLCRCYLEQYGVDFVVARPGHIYGPTARPEDKKISSDFAFRAARHEDLCMKSAGRQRRSYCHSFDCASALVSILTEGQSGAAYNVGNSSSVISIRRMVEILASMGGSRLTMEAPSDSEEKAFNPMDNSSLDVTKLESLGWKGCFSAEEGLSHTVEILRDVYS